MTNLSDFMKVYIKEEVDSDTEVKEESEEVGGFDWKYSCLETEIKEENNNITIIENKKTDAITVKAKEKTWEGIALTFNQVAQTGIRTPNQLHALYLTLKKKAKKDNASDRIEMYKTGGDTDTKCHTVDLKKLGDTVESSDTNTSQLVGTIGIGQNSFTSVAEADTNTTPTQATRPVADSTAGANKRKCVAGFESDLDDTISKRKNVKPDFDKQLFKRKMEILDLEMKTKKNQFENSKLQLENTRLQLEHSKIQLEIIKFQKAQIITDHPT
ncbi:hypothetical protein C0J52_10709 [Blattella germanica]|nr:hypothetical protein C0J52_10709 [Blattella germanica]